MNRVSHKKSGIGTVNAGGAIVIIIFVVLCLAVFGLLAFATAFADKKLADKTLESMERYYAADSEAEQKLSEIYNALIDSLKNNAIPVIEGANLHEEWAENGGRAFTVEFNTDMGISKSAEARFYLKSGIYFHYTEQTGTLSHRVREWRVIVDSDFTYDERELELWMPDFGVWGGEE